MCNILNIYFPHSFIYLVCLHFLCVEWRLGECIYGHQWIICRSQFFSSTMWIIEIQVFSFNVRHLIPLSFLPDHYNWNDWGKHQLHPVHSLIPSIYQCENLQNWCTDSLLNSWMNNVLTNKSSNEYLHLLTKFFLNIKNAMSEMIIITDDIIIFNVILYAKC